MPTDAAFRLSVYLTLAFACAAVGYAESPLLFEAPIVAGAVIIALAVLYRLETRVNLLTIPAANRLGLLLGLGNLVWMLFRMLRELNNPQMINTDWAILGLALLGRFMTLMPAKRHVANTPATTGWLRTGPCRGGTRGGHGRDISRSFIGAYFVCAIWSLGAFSLLRSSGRIQPIPGQENRTRIVGVVADNRSRFGFALPIALTILAAAVSTPLYLLTPRSTFEKLEFGKPRVEIGFAADQMVDLKQTGDLRANTKVAFEVFAETASGPRDDLSPDQRWRGRVLRQYRGGEWLEAGDVRLPAVEPAPRIVAQWSLPELWPRQTILTYSLPAGSRGRFLADPVTWVDNEPSPVATITSSGYRSWIWVGNGSFSSESRQRTMTEPLRYVQIWRPEADADLSPPLKLVDTDVEGIIGALCLNPVQKVKVYTDELIERMVADGLLPRNHFDRTSMLPRREFHEGIARAFSHHLATTPTLTYSTNLRRERKDLDPIEDFLFHTRSGHCERFATTLVLMLRSQGIPAVMVLGFKGCETTEEPGRYIVREEFAHAWVEALIEEYEPLPWWGIRRTSRWLSLDPTPSGGGANSSDEGWVQRPDRWLRRMYNACLSTIRRSNARSSCRHCRPRDTRRPGRYHAGLIAAILAAPRASSRGEGSDQPHRSGSIDSSEFLGPQLRALPGERRANSLRVPRIGCYRIPGRLPRLKFHSIGLKRIVKRGLAVAPRAIESVLDARLEEVRLALAALALPGERNDRKRQEVPRRIVRTRRDRRSRQTARENPHRGDARW